jgi:hypothetical protein
MKLILIGLLTSVLAWAWNRFLQMTGLPEPFRVGWAVPIGEESLKFLAAVGSAQPFWAVYLLFGLIEGSYEYARSDRASSWRLFVAGPLFHGGLGMVYFLVPPRLGLLVATVLHIVWNNTIIWRRNHYKNSSK